MVVSPITFFAICEQVCIKKLRWQKIFRPVCCRFSGKSRCFLNRVACLCIFVVEVWSRGPDVPGQHTRSPAFMADLFVIMAFKRSHVLIKMTDH